MIVDIGGDSDSDLFEDFLEFRIVQGGWNFTEVIYEGAGGPAELYYFTSKSSRRRLWNPRGDFLQYITSIGKLHTRHASDIFKVVLNIKVWIEL